MGEMKHQMAHLACDCGGGKRRANRPLTSLTDHKHSGFGNLREIIFYGYIHSFNRALKNAYTRICSHWQ